MKRAPLSSSHRIVSSWPPFAAATHTSSQNDVSKYPRRCRLRSVLRHPRSAACSGLSSCELPDSPNASRIISVNLAIFSRSASETRASTSQGTSESESEARRGSV